MKWIKKGLLYEPDRTKWWSQHYGILPTPEYLPKQDIIRIYFSTTCKDRYGRVTYIEVSAKDPSKILYTHPTYILDVGEDGCFDDCGVNISAISIFEECVYMYYAGYQRHTKTPYSILTGLAVADKQEMLFRRYSQTPILERTSEESNLRSAPTVIRDENGLWKMWYVAGIGWRNVSDGIHQGKKMPIYVLKYGTSTDGIHWQILPQPVMSHQNDEFGFGRPYVIKENDKYKMWYSIRRLSLSYRIGYAESHDGIYWQRKDEEIGIDVSETGWDSEMICYPAVLPTPHGTYLFYNGNNNGETGFGYAILAE